MSTSTTHLWTRTALALCLGASLGTTPAAATPLTLTYTGTFHAADALSGGGGSDLITGDTPFTFMATFDPATANLVAPLPIPGPGQGFVAYAPMQASFTIGGATYQLTGLGTPGGPSIAVFDPSNIFNPGRYGIGLIVNPLADGAGFVGDFLGASPGFSVTSLGPTTFTGFTGVGFSGGTGCGPDPAPCTLQPIALTLGGQAFSLQIQSVAGVQDGSVSYDGGTDTARLSAAVPEPSTWATMLLGFAGMGGALRRRRGKWRTGVRVS